MSGSDTCPALAEPMGIPDDGVAVGLESTIDSILELSFSANNV
jgi:hypothetical protein